MVTLTQGKRGRARANTSPATSVDGPAGPCIHHYILGPQERGEVPGACKKCGHSRIWLVPEEDIWEQGRRDSWAMKRRVPRVGRTCLVCGGTFEVTAKQVGKYCSHACHREARRQAAKRIARQCHYCGQAFEVTESDLRKGKGRFCSRECVYHAARKAMREAV